MLVKTLFRKIKSLFHLIFFYFSIITILPLRILLILLKPIINVRFTFISGDRIGSLTLDTFLEFGIIKEKKKKRTINFLVFFSPISNKFFLSKLQNFAIKNLKNTYLVEANWFYKTLFNSFSVLNYPKKNFSENFAKDNFLDNNQQYFNKNLDYSKLSNNENDKGFDLIKKFKIDTKKPWICFHNRDSEYLNKFFPDRDFSHHSYRDFDIGSMLSAAELFTKNGYNVIRMGKIQKEQLSTTNPMIFDYPFSNLKSDFADIFLFSKCSAYFGSDSGVQNLALVYNKPTFLINFSLNILTQFMKGGLNSSRFHPYPFIFKNIFDPNKGRNLTLNEIFDHDLFANYSSKYFNSLGLKHVSNSSDDILEFSQDVLEYLKGNWKLDHDDLMIQEEFWNIIYKRTNLERINKIPAPIGKSFLKKNLEIIN